MRGIVSNQFGALHGDLLDAGHILAEHHATLQGRGRIIDMNDGAARADQAFIGPLDQMVAGLGQDLDGDIIRNMLLVD